MIIKLKNLNKYKNNSFVRVKEKSENVQLLEEVEDFVKNAWRKITKETLEKAFKEMSNHIRKKEHKKIKYLIIKRFLNDDLI